MLDKDDNETKLMLVASAYEIGGGDSYWMLGALNGAENYGGYQYIPEIATPAGNYGDAVADYVNAVYGGTVPADAYPLNSGRITRVNDPYKAAEFTSTLTFTDGGKPLASTALTAYINGEKSEVTTDGEGVLTLTLKNGANELRFLGDGYDSGSLYLDNYCGLHNAAVENNPGEVLPDGAEEAPVSSVPAATTPEAPTAQNNTVLIVCLVVLLAVVVAAVAVYFYRKKKSK